VVFSAGKQKVETGVSWGWWVRRERGEVKDRVKGSGRETWGGREKPERRAIMRK
jgi:hypothetical protein